MAGQPVGEPLILPDGTQLPLAKGMKAGDFVFTSGQVGVRPGQAAADNVEEQTRACLANIRNILVQAGADLGDVVKTTVWLTRVEDFGAFNAVYAEYFPDGPPARSTVCSALMLPGLLVEIEAIAYVP